MKTSVKVFAPATVANVAVGFDSLGFAIDALGDLITVTRIERTGRAGPVEIESISGIDGIPLEPSRNTAGAALLDMCRTLELPFGFRLQIEKGIPLGSGMGGSACSAVGAVVAANALLEQPVSERELLKFAATGEAIASGSVHGDNIAPCLLGGLTLVRAMEPEPDVVKLPVPEGVHAVVVHPGTRLDTRDARAALSSQVALKAHVRQSADYAAFVAALYLGDFGLLRRAMRDTIVEPQRQHLIPGFSEVQQAAFEAGAIGCSISGAGPSIFAWADGRAQAERIQEAMLATLSSGNARAWISPIRLQGAQVLL